MSKDSCPWAGQKFNENPNIKRLDPDPKTYAYHKLQNTTTKLEAIHEVDNNKTLNSLGSTTSHSSSSSENTATNITNSIKSEIKKKSTLKKANTPSITSSSNKKITTPVNIKLDYIKNWVPGKRTKSMTSSSNASDNNTNINIRS